MRENELKPCPFCGGKANLVYYEDDSSIAFVDCEEELESVSPAFIHCYECDMDYFPDSDIAKDVMRAWNRRIYERN